MMARRPPALALVQPGSLDDAVHVRALLASTLPVIRARTAALREEVEAGNQLRDQAALAKAALVDSRAELKAERVALARFEADQRLRSQNLIQSRSEEHTSELQSLMRISYAVFCLKKKKQQHTHHNQL